MKRYIFIWLGLGHFARYLAVTRTDFPPLVTSYLNGTSVWCFVFAMFAAVVWWKKRKLKSVISPDTRP